MGTYSKSNFGAISGKVGQGVGSHWRSINYLRSLPKKSGKPATVLQLAVQSKFAISAAQLSPIKDILNLGFSDKKLNDVTGYNAAVKALIKDAIVGVYPNFTVDYSKMQLSKGSLSPLSSLTMAYATDLNIDWTSKVNPFNSFADDQVLALIYNATTNVYLIDESFTRADANIVMDIASEIGDVVHVWAFCIKRDGKTVSPSQYVGTLTVS